MSQPTTSQAVGSSTGVALEPQLPRARRVNLNPRRRISTGSDGAPQSSQVEEIRNRARRRSSLLSNYSLSDATRDLQEEIIDPMPEDIPVDLGPITSWKSWLPFTFAVLPPLAGLFFKNGATFSSDLCLLGLVAVFLHWSVTAPWRWYYSAQQVRENQEAVVEEALEASSRPSSQHTSDSEVRGRTSSRDRREHARQAATALSRLQRHEQLALLACFLAPAASAYLLFFVRQILTPRTEGLVSGFNLAIFLLAAEVRPLSHSIKLVLSQTLHLQRIVHSNPYRLVQVTPERYQELNRRVSDLEIRALAVTGPENGGETQTPQDQLTKQSTQDVLASIQPQIDALTRAVRRYERKSRMLEHRMDARFRQLEARVDDVAALAAMAARNLPNKQRGVIGRVAGGGWYVATIPVTMMYHVMGQFARPVYWIFGKDGDRRATEGSLARSGRGSGRIAGSASTSKRR
ncbi:hypothetical protein VTI74DRAFT_3074 [Chaetomium olivicolor]